MRLIRKGRKVYPVRVRRIIHTASSFYLKPAEACCAWRGTLIPRFHTWDVAPANTMQALQGMRKRLHSASLALLKEEQ